MNKKLKNWDKTPAYKFQPYNVAEMLKNRSKSERKYNVFDELILNKRENKLKIGFLAESTAQTKQIFMRNDQLTGLKTDLNRLKSTILLPSIKLDSKN